MKKIIRILADISGVTNDIRNEEKENLDVILQSFEQWFGGVNNHRKHVYNAVVKVKEYLKKGVYPCASGVRSYVDENSNT